MLRGSLAGLIVSPPKGSKPSNKMGVGVMMGLSIFVVRAGDLWGERRIGTHFHHVGWLGWNGVCGRRSVHVGVCWRESYRLVVCGVCNRGDRKRDRWEVYNALHRGGSNLAPIPRRSRADRPHQRDFARVIAARRLGSGEVAWRSPCERRVGRSAQFLSKRSVAWGRCVRHFRVLRIPIQPRWVGAFVASGRRSTLLSNQRNAWVLWEESYARSSVWRAVFFLWKKKRLRYRGIGWRPHKRGMRPR